MRLVFRSTASEVPTLFPFFFFFCLYMVKSPQRDDWLVPTGLLPFSVEPASRWAGMSFPHKASQFDDSTTKKKKNVSFDYEIAYSTLPCGSIYCPIRERLERKTMTTNDIIVSASTRICWIVVRRRRFLFTKAKGARMSRCSPVTHSSWILYHVIHWGWRWWCVFISSI